VRSSATTGWDSCCNRGSEYEADDLGIRYLATAGYDPAALSSTLASLAAQNTLDARIRGTNSAVPQWASTHPDPASRVARAMANARASGSTKTFRNADVFLSNIDGMLYGDDPKEGLVDGNRFLHPAFRLKFSVPQGFALENGTAAVSINGSSGQAQFTGGAYDGDLSAYIASAFQKLSGQSGGSAPNVQKTTVNGLPAAYATLRASAQDGSTVDVTVFAYEFGPKTAFHFVTLTAVGSGLGPFQPMIQSMARMTDKEAADVKPRRLRVVTVKKGDTVATLSKRMAFADYQTDRFLVLNALATNATLKPGQKVKIVTY